MGAIDQARAAEILDQVAARCAGRMEEVVVADEPDFRRREYRLPYTDLPWRYDRTEVEHARGSIVIEHLEFIHDFASGAIDRFAATPAEGEASARVECYAYGLSGEVDEAAVFEAWFGWFGGSHPVAPLPSE